MKSTKKQSLFLGFACVFSFVLGLLMVEGVLRVANGSMKNYDIEMWRYAKELKRPSADPNLGHEHVPNRIATLQGVSIRTNEYGLRGRSPMPKGKTDRDILFLGSSITLGWGVSEDDTLSMQIELMMNQRGVRVQTLNAGIGNYNAPRYVRRFVTKLADLKPTDIVVHYFLRDAEPLERGGGNWFLRNSQLAVTLWNVSHRFLNRTGPNALEEHYKKIYEPGSPGRVAMEAALTELAKYAKTESIRLYLAMTPDVHDLTDYKFGYIHETMKTIAGNLGYKYVDLYPALQGMKPAEIYSMPGDPHPNAAGHRKMAAALLPVLLETPSLPRTLSSSR
jgi:hypothetical protein